MKRKDRMMLYITRINKLLCNLPPTKCNEILCRALWATVMFSHPDIAEKINEIEVEAE